MIWDYVFQLIATAGGVTAASLALIKFGGSKIVDLLFKKYETLQEQSLEKYKSELSQKQYITEKLFDKKIDVFESLTADFSTLIIMLEEVIPADGNLNYPSEPNKWKEYVSGKCDALTDSASKAQNDLLISTPFIKEDHEKEYLEILGLINQQIKQLNLVKTKSRTDILNTDDFEKTKQIREKFRTLNSSIGNYLDSLQVLN